MPEKIGGLSIVFFALAIGGLLCTGCSQQASLEKRLAITKEFEVDHFVEFAKMLPEDDMLVPISKRLPVAFDEIKRTNNSLKKPYLVIVLLIHRTLVDDDETYSVHIEWFQNRFVSHLVKFTNTDTMESWTYSFQSDYYDRDNKGSLGVRFIEGYQFGRQASGVPFVTLEEGISLTELARIGKLKAVLVNEEGQTLSNEVLVDFHKRRFLADDAASKNGEDSTGNQSDGLAPAAL